MLAGLTVLCVCVRAWCVRYKRESETERGWREGETAHKSEGNFCTLIWFLIFLGDHAVVRFCGVVQGCTNYG